MFTKKMKESIKEKPQAVINSGWFRKWSFLSHHSASMRPKWVVSLLRRWSVERACCAFGVHAQRQWRNSPLSLHLHLCAHDASVTPLRHCNRLHCSSLFRLSAHAWQFDCLSFPHRFPPIISALCVLHPPLNTTPLPCIPYPPLPLSLIH